MKPGTGSSQGSYLESRVSPVTLAIMIAAFLAGACGGDSSGPTDPPNSGSIVVTATTAGVRFDPDGYVVMIDGGATRVVNSNGSVTISGLSAGSHAITINGYDLNCVPSSPSSASVLVTAGATTTHEVLVTCGYLAYVQGNDEILVFETASHSVVRTLPINALSFVASPDGRSLYATVALPGPDAVLVISTDTHQILEQIPVPESPGAIEISSDGQHLFMQHGGEISVLEIATGTIVANELIIPQIGVFFTDLEISPNETLIYNMVFVREIVVYDWMADLIVQRIPLADASVQGRQMELSQDGQDIYVMSFDSNAVNSMENVTRLDAMSGAPVATTPVTSDPSDMRITPNGAEVWVTHSRDPGIAIVDVATFSEVANIVTEVRPLQFEFTPDGAYAYIANPVTSNLMVVSTADREVVTRVPAVFGFPRPFAFAGDRN